MPTTSLLSHLSMSATLCHCCKRLRLHGADAGSVSVVLKLLLMVLVGVVLLHYLLEALHPSFIHGNFNIYAENKTHSSQSHARGRQRSASQLEVAEIVPNCGVEEVCPPLHFPVHIFSSTEMPRVCVTGKYVIQGAVNDGGRGINIVVVDPHRMEAVAANRFDTYGHESGRLVEYLHQVLSPQDIVIAVTFDEASRNLGQKARAMFANLGSSEIQNLNFHSQWFMVGQQDLGGFTPYEQLLTVQPGHGMQLSKRMCIPQRIPSQAIKPDPLQHRNVARAEFCSHHPDLEDFCSVYVRSMELVAAPQTNQHLAGSPVYSSPILVLARHSLVSLSVTLESLIHQPGIQIKSVLVVYDAVELPDTPQLSLLFGIKTQPLNAQVYQTFVKTAIESIKQLFPKAHYVTVIKEGVILSPDFLAYIANVLPLLNDPSLQAVSAWNPNGYVGVSGRTDVLYRIEDSPCLAYTLRYADLQHNLYSNATICQYSCCGESGRETVIPEVSRVLMSPSAVQLESDDAVAHALFFRLRVTNLNPHSAVHGAHMLHDASYGTYLMSLLNSSNASVVQLSKSQVEECAAEPANGKVDDAAAALKLHTSRRPASAVYVVAYREANSSAGYPGMMLLCRCFGLFYHRDSPVRGLHQGLLRFSIDDSEVILLSDRSPYFALLQYSSTLLQLP